MKIWWRKLFSIFHTSNVLLHQQYRKHDFKKYLELISSLLVVEQNIDLLMKNHMLRPIVSVPLPEANGMHCLKKMQYQNKNMDVDVDVDTDVINHGWNNKKTISNKITNFKRQKANESSASKWEHKKSCFKFGTKAN